MQSVKKKLKRQRRKNVYRKKKKRRKGRKPRRRLIRKKTKLSRKLIQITLQLWRILTVKKNPLKVCMTMRLDFWRILLHIRLSCKL